MNQLAHLISQHPAIATGIIFVIVNGAITSLPSPKPDSSIFYQWFFGFTHSVLGNLSRVLATRIPDVQPSIINGDKKQ